MALFTFAKSSVVLYMLHKSIAITALQWRKAFRHCQYPGHGHLHVFAMYVEAFAAHLHDGHLHTRGSPRGVHGRKI